MADELKMVSVDSLNIDSYQRAFDKARVRRIAKRFIPQAMKVISVSRRKDGSLWCYDGQHTLELAKLCGLREIAVRIVDGDKKSEARWFNEINENSKRVSARAGYLAGICAEDDEKLRAKTFLDKFGLEISTGGLVAGKTNSISSIMRYSAEDPKSLDSAMSAIALLWPEEKEAWSGTVIRGMYEVSKKGLINSITIESKRKKVTPRRILDVSKAIQLASGSDGGGSGVAYRAILQLCGIK